MGFLGKLIYPLFGIAVLVAYSYVVRHAIEPFQVSSERHPVPTGAAARTAGTGYRRTPGVYVFGGFGGK